MPASRRVECPVVFPTDTLQVGEFANAFRVMPDSTTEVLLDFCLYSSTANVAKVVARVRVAWDYLSLVDARLQEAITEFDAMRAGATTTVRDGLLVNQAGVVILFGGTTGEEN